jgi:hypothetical protein
MLSRCKVNYFAIGANWTWGVDGSFFLALCIKANYYMQPKCPPVFEVFHRYVVIVMTTLCMS